MYMISRAIGNIYLICREKYCPFRCIIGTGTVEVMHQSANVRIIPVLTVHIQNM